MIDNYNVDPMDKRTKKFKDIEGIINKAFSRMTKGNNSYEEIPSSEFDSAAKQKKKTRNSKLDEQTLKSTITEARREISELSVETLRNYRDRASDEVENRNRNSNRKKIQKRIYGIGGAERKMMNKGVRQRDL